jgi:predicted transcriptional regulator
MEVIAEKLGLNRQTLFRKLKARRKAGAEKAARRRLLLTGKTEDLQQ